MKLFGTETKQQRTDRLEAERIAASNRKRELDRQRGFIAQLDLDVSVMRSRISEIRQEAAELEARLPKRERKLAQERARLAQLESA